MRTLSPFRYPGGKYSLRYLIRDLIEEKGNVDFFVEPFAGGAGISLWLIQNNFVKKVKINDFDTLIYLVWKTILYTPYNIIKRIEETDINLENWEIQKKILKDEHKFEKFSELDLGFAAFFVNRCSRSGMITNRVGPIGGKKQLSEWKIDARFNKRELIKKIEMLSNFSDRIEISNEDAVVMLNKLVTPVDNTLVYIDPPYFKQGPELYRQYFEKSDHLRLAEYLQNGFEYQWIVSYDNNDFITEIYKHQTIEKINLFHRAQKQHIGEELIIQRKK